MAQAQMQSTKKHENIPMVIKAICERLFAVWFNTAKKKAKCDYRTQPTANGWWPFKWCA